LWFKRIKLCLAQELRREIDASCVTGDALGTGIASKSAASGDRPESKKPDNKGEIAGFAAFAPRDYGFHTPNYWTDFHD
jgi:hypothetical protein